MRCIIFLMLSCTLVAQAAAVTLPKIFSSNMVLQRDRPVVVWGWAGKGETVTVVFNGQSKQTKASSTGEWSVTLTAMKFGGPFAMQIKGKKESVTFDNILIGDVWLCSGQSNMEWLLVNSNNATQEIANSDHASVRLFTVEKEMSYAANPDIKDGKWEVCSPGSSKNFSAVAYFFGRKLNQDLNIPIGLINSSWGGTNVETWISWDVMSKKDEFKKVDIQKLIAGSPEMKKKREAYDEALHNDVGMRDKWYSPSASVAGWGTATAPKEWGGTAIGDADGVVWFRKTFSLDEADAQSGGVLSLGPIDDWDETYVNGEKIGARQMYNEDRLYQVPKGLLRAGENTVVVKITDTGGGGGFWGKPEQMYCSVGTKKVSLAGEWSYKAAALTSDYGITTDGPNSFPSQLYNAMIAPIIKYPIAGAIWYQGESNAGEAYKYRTGFPDLIKDWRAKWGYEFPFFWAQLANYMAPAPTPQPSAWAELREAQSMTLSLPKTGQAVIIDIGEADD
ncbi:MAG: 9-O-acetylesterase, partial [Bacteroidia bacterium]|nr:9-O-acetylesterase [Bacteroidia bacterium]